MQRIDETLHSLKKNIEDIDEKKFEDMKNIILMGLTSESADIEEEFENDWAQISRKEVEFNRGIKILIFFELFVN